jgi:CRISPR-associated protein
MAGSDRDLVMITLAGVQRFISESRSTADLHAGSSIVSELAVRMVKSALKFDADVDLVLPSPEAKGSTPNRLVVRVAAGKGADLAEHMAGAARGAWREYEVRPWQPRGDNATWETSPAILANATDAATAVPRTPGFPAIQWVAVPSAEAGYEAQWDRAAAALRARKHIRDFAFAPVDQMRMCSLTGRWTAMPEPPDGAWNVRRNEQLSVAGHAKRAFSRKARQGFPSTWSIASAPYRAAIIEAAARDEGLRAAVENLRNYLNDFLGAVEQQDSAKLGRRSGQPPGMPSSDDRVLTWLREAEGAWCAPSTWDAATLRYRYDLEGIPDEDYCGAVRDEASKLAGVAAHRGLAPLTSYLAVVVQDADRMGVRLGRFPRDCDPLKWHNDVSAALATAARRQRDTIEAPGSLGKVVYAGGDDLLALVPAATALSSVRAANAAFCEVMGKVLDEPTASAAIVFFHAAWPLQSAIEAARRLLEEAKDAGRPGLGLAVLRRGGERNRLVLPWADPADGRTPMLSHVETLASSLGGEDAGLSGRLAAGLERDQAALDTLGPTWLARELSRRCLRHGGDAAAGEALLALSYEDAMGRRRVPDAAVTVARFLAGETGSAPERAPLAGAGAR